MTQPPQWHLLLTGTPGSGKTTVIRQVGEQLADERPGGLYTEEIRAAEVAHLDPSQSRSALRV